MSEILSKPSRPYIMLEVSVADSVKSYIPLRSNINHRYAFFTNIPQKCGLDYTKAIFLTDDFYVEKNRKPVIDKAELLNITGQELLITRKMIQFICYYRKAKEKIKVNPKYEILVRCSTLQYFEQIIFNIPGVS